MVNKNRKPRAHQHGGENDLALPDGRQPVEDLDQIRERLPTRVVKS